MGMEIGWSEMLVIAVVLIVVVGPKDLPKMLRSFGRTTAKLRQMAGDFQKQFSEALEEAELGDVKKAVDDLKGLNPATQIKKHLNPFEQAASEVRAGLDSLKSSATAAPTPEDQKPSEPLYTAPATEASPAAPEATKSTAEAKPTRKPSASKVAGSKPSTTRPQGAKPASRPAAKPKAKA